jgi:nucleotide-binding universal stress UspA family protein
MNVLLGVDGTDLSYEAVARTVDRARETGEDLSIAILDREEVALEPAAIEARVVEQVDAAAVDADVRHLDGHPGSELVALADRGGFDRLVVPGGHRSALGKVRLDETLEFVLLNAETTVTLVR